MKKRSDPVPAWLTSNTGIINTVPAPWTPVRVARDIVSCWGRDHAFARTPFPSQVTVQGTPLLERPVTLRAVVHGQDCVFRTGALRSLERHPHGRYVRRAAVSRAGDLLLNTEVTVHYDGAVRVDIRLDPLKPLTLDALSFAVPVRRDRAPLIMAVHKESPPGDRVFPPDRIPAGGWTGPFDCPAVWLGTEERGLTLFSESDEGWDPGEGAVRVEADGRSVTASFEFVRAPRALAAPCRFSVGLQANPWRPPEKNCDRFRNFHYHSLYDLTDADLKSLYAKGYRTLIFHEWWAIWHAYPAPRAERDLTALVRRCRRAGLKLLVYFGSEFSRYSPEWPDWGVHWLVKDVPGHRGSPHVCFRSEWPDFIVHGVDRLLKRYDLDGVYLDAWALWADHRCDNPIHGCGYTRPDGARRPTFPFWACRDLMERIYVTVKTCKPDGQLSLHANPGLCMAQFGTDCFAGEGFHGDFSKVSLPTVRALHMGREPWGTFSELIATADYDFGQAVGLLHGVLPRAGAYEMSHKTVEDPPAAVWKIQDAFGTARAAWHPYWRNGALVAAAPEPVKVSLWNRPGQGALLVISNLSDREQAAEVTVQWGRLGCRGALAALDLWPEGAPALLEGRRLKAVLPAGRCRLVCVAPPDSPLWPRLRRARAWAADLFARRKAATTYDDWLAVGPFGEDDAAPYLPPGSRYPEVPPGYRGLETEYAPERGPVNPEAVFEGAGGRRCGWVKLTAENGDAPLPKEILRPKWDVVYAYSRILFPTLIPSVPDNPVELHVWSHHAFALRVNGTEVFRYGGAGTPRYGQMALPLNEHAIRVILRPGWNDVLLKLVAREGSNFKYAIKGEGGARLPPLLVRARE